ncbi:MAG: polysaccharide deacetylase family protein [Rhodospirillales bacterium]|nr:polysaccharide deacetylase family protein [Rhodospirillales bacterium]
MACCLNRRALLAAPVFLPLAAAQAADAPIEPRLRLASPPSGGRSVVLTFDACPGAFDMRIAATLVERRIPATIFVTGLWLSWNRQGLAYFLAHPDIFGFENHGARHIPAILGKRTIFGLPVAGDLPAIDAEITQGQAAITAATGATPRWYRSAAGYYTPSVIPEIHRLGFGIGGYSLSADVGASLPAAAVAGRMAAARNGDVIVAHINQPHRPSGLGVVEGLGALQRSGTRFLRLDQLDPSALAGA